MTDEELLAGLKRANDLLAQYKEAAQPYADELARRKSLAAFGHEGAYEGKLGCFDTGSDVLCSHRAEAYRNLPWEEDRPREEKGREFDDEWGQRARNAGLNHIHISGYY